MQQAILVINFGSSNLKFSVFEVVKHTYKLTSVPIVRGQIAPLDTNSQIKVISNDNSDLTQAITLSSSKKKSIQSFAIEYLLDWIGNHFTNVKIMAVGHRIVHGGNLFTAPVIVDAKILKQLNLFSPLAPLHQPFNLLGIQLLLNQQPEIKQVACFDTAFHTTQSNMASAYAIPQSITQQLIKRYGFHGLSYEYIAQVLPDYLVSAKANGKVIVAHLGHGASLCAMIERKSIATTMGFTALDGLAMGTRCGNIDPGVILYLLSEKGMTVSDVTDLLYNKSGLLGVSGISDDINTLLKSNNPKAKFAVDLFIYRIVREIGSLITALGGLDAIVFTGGIGEHCAAVRAEVCKQLSWLGIKTNRAANKINALRIADHKSTISLLVIPTNEELVIAQHTLSCIAQVSISQS